MLAVLAGSLFLGGRWYERQVQLVGLRLPLIEAVLAGDKEKVRSLLDQGADPEVRMDYRPEKWTLMSVWRMLRGQKTVSEQLTVLMWASANDQPEIVERLLDHGADPNLKSGGAVNVCALNLAANQGAWRPMEILLRHGAHIEWAHGEERGTLYDAVEGDSGQTTGKNHAACTALLLRHGADTDLKDPKVAASLLNKAALYGNTDLLRLYLQYGVDVNGKDEDGQTALMTAAKPNRFHIDHLFDGENTVATYPDRQHTLGYLAAEALLRAGADVNAVDPKGRTALMSVLDLSGLDQNDLGIATFDGYYLAIARLLLRYGADVRLQDKHGRTPLQIAEKLGETEILPLLRKAAARAPKAGKAAGR